MGQVSEFKRNVYSGAVADNAAITPADGDTFYATDTDQLFIGHGGSWVHHPRFVQRLVDVADFDQTDFTADGTWKVNGLDLSGIVPVGATAVNLRVVIRDDAADTSLDVRKNAIDTLNALSTRTQVANIFYENTAPVAIDPDRLMDYMVTNVVVTTIQFIVLGWWI